MKILVVDNMFSPLENNLNSAGGFERRNLTDAILLAVKDKVYYTHAGPKARYDFPFTPVHIHEETAENAKSPASWRNQVKRNILTWIDKNKPDVVLFGSNTMMSLATEIAAKCPIVVHVASFLTGNGFIDSGRMTSFLRVSCAGGYFVFNTEGTHKIFMEQAKDQAVKLSKNASFSQHFETFKWFRRNPAFADYTNEHNMGVGLVGRKLDQKPKRDKGYVVIASRCDPAKMVHKFTNIKVPTKIFWKERAVSSKNDYLKKNTEKFSVNKNVELIMNADYSTIMDTFAAATCCFVTWPDETYGLTAFEAASFGVPSVVFKREANDINCTEEFLSRVYRPKIVTYKSKDWKEQYVNAFEQYHDWDSSKRLRLMRKFESVYSQENYLKEKRLVLRNAIKKWEQLQ